MKTLGNLTLLNQYLNPAASNGSFDMKCEEYKHSVLRLNRYFDSIDTWDEDAIQQRGADLGARLCKLWLRAAVQSAGATSGLASKTSVNA